MSTSLIINQAFINRKDVKKTVLTQYSVELYIRIIFPMNADTCFYIYG
jgi:hypothetical protein